MNRLGIGLPVCALLCLCGTALARQPVQAVTANMNWMDRVRLRAGPDADAPVPGRCFSGARVTVLEAEGAWWHVRVDEREGYMMSRYLTAEVPADAAANELTAHFSRDLVAQARRSPAAPPLPFPVPADNRPFAFAHSRMAMR